MKKYILPIIVALLALFVQGCGLLTFHPIFTPEQLVFESRLTGKWKAQDGSIEFEPASKAVDEIPEPLRPYTSRFYLCTRRDNDGKVEKRFLAFLVKLGNNHFMDLYPIETEKTVAIDNFFKSHDLKMHTISKIEFANGSLRWVDFKDNYVTDLIKNRQVRISHTFLTPLAVDAEKEIVVTASTQELQSFLLKYGDRKEAFNPADETNTYLKIK